MNYAHRHAAWCLFWARELSTPWTPTPRRIDGDGSRSHWTKRRTQARKQCRRLVERSRWETTC